MLFNSYEFILAFLPITVAGFLFLGLFSRAWALGWLMLASVVFYAWWRPFNLLIIGPSIAVNYVFASWLADLASNPAKERKRGMLLTLGILFNVGLLGYFKYANFAVSVVNDAAGTDFVFKQIILPLGISFITFQKIAFLIDVAGGRIKSFTLRDFLLFVLFFPQLIAGPIVHWSESIPQFQKATAKFDRNAYAAGLTLFLFGLFKKVVLADGIAKYVSPVFAYAAGGQHATLVESWMAAVGYTFQIYFDFSGYSDMACGAALFFGIRLPMNFDSPLRATNIIDFWLRWHITLTRFLTAYIYTPLTLNLMRKRAAKKLPLLRGTGTKLTAFVQVLAFPTIMTMLVSGVWHGAGYTFIAWGLLHGVYLVIAHGWRQYGPKKKPAAEPIPAQAAPARMGMPAIGLHVLAPLGGWALTFLSVVVAMVLFRAPNFETAGNVLRGMLGMHGLGLPKFIADIVHMPALGGMTVGAGDIDARSFVFNLAYLVGVAAIGLLMPNVLQIMSKTPPTLQFPSRPPKIGLIGPAVYWSASLPWMIFIAGLAAVGMWMLTGQSEFLYWQF